MNWLDLRVVYRPGRSPVVMDEHDVIGSDDLLWDLNYAKQRHAGEDYADRRPPEERQPCVDKLRYGFKLFPEYEAKGTTPCRVNSFKDIYDAIDWFGLT